MMTDGRKIIVNCVLLTFFRLDREHRAHITASQANLQALLDQHQNEDELSPLEEEYGSPLNFTAAAAS